MAGRKPKPTAVKKLEGNPGKRKLNTKEPVPAKGMPTCPNWLLPEAKSEWKRLAELMNQMGVLTEVDRAHLRHTASPMLDGRKPRNTSIPRALHLKPIRVTNSRLHGLVSQILIRS